MVAGSLRRCGMPSRDDLWVEIVIDDEAPLPESLTVASLTSLAHHVLSEEGMAGDWQVGVRFLDDSTMQKAHLDYMGIDTPTDIMTFPYDDAAFGELVNEEAVQGGDLMISVDRAADHARDEGWSTAEELRFLVIHGLLHILGWDDPTDDERARMLERQADLLESWSRN